LLPLGISFYSFQAIAYNIDVYRGNLAPRGNFIDFALFLSFFPRLVAGPIERGANLLPQIEKEPSWQWQSFSAAWPLLICGYAKKVVIADNIAVYVNKVFALQCPSVFLLMAASLAFTLQIYADFSAYTDIARGSARLFGFELMENFKFPYSAISPSDFWRRWHISFSTWIRDYLYIPMGGSRRNHWWKQFLVLLVVLGLSGLWHGAAWHFIVWGLYYGILIYLYRVTGFGSGWSPCTQLGKLAAWALMFFFIVFGWAIFRAPSLSWLVNAISGDAPPMIGEASMVAGLVILIWTSVLAMPFTIFKYLSDNQYADKRTLRVVLAAGLIVLITFFAPELQQDFIYFQF
jgi:D-alanyl-lipoteichoic acid acyltransferase DltB (MBOAT superfamily)